MQVQGLDVRINDAGRCVLTMVNGKAMPVTLEEYRERLAERLVAEAPTVDDLRARWVAPDRRQDLLGRLPDAGRAPLVLQQIQEQNDYDLYDLLQNWAMGSRR